MRVILTYGRAWSALSAARSLGKRGIEVIAGDEYDFAPAALSKYTIGKFKYPNPDLEPEAFLDTLEGVIRKYKPADGEEYVLMPVHKEAYLVARHRERFEPLIKMALPTIVQIEQVHDKGTLAQYCIREGLPIPKTVVPESRDEFVRAAAGFGYPAFVKVRQSAAAVGVKKVGSAEEAVAVFDGFVKDLGLGDGGWPLIQEGIPGDDYCATFLFDHGQLRAAMTYHNLRSFPAKSGTGVLRETVKAPAIEAIGAELLTRLNWHGVAEIDFRWNGKDDSPAWLIEVNPRFWGGMPQAVEAGWDYPHLLYRLAVDGHVDPVEPHDTNVRTETPVMGLLATLHEVIHDEPRMAAMKGAWEKLKRSYVRGGRRRALRSFVNNFKDAADVSGRLERMKELFRDHRHSVSDVFKWNDPLPALGFLYPMAVFLKHGKVSTELLVSEGRAGVKARA
ncbi:MAG: ATP-grasp domain-containing protein [Planctomycetes bacterium]|nr:ATP-grasp domain-containing protein [Planctomycetota bacterium]